MGLLIQVTQYLGSLEPNITYPCDEAHNKQVQLINLAEIVGPGRSMPDLKGDSAAVVYVVSQWHIPNTFIRPRGLQVSCMTSLIRGSYKYGLNWGAVQTTTKPKGQTLKEVHRFFI